MDSATVAKTTQRQTDKSNCYYRLLTLNPNHNFPTQTEDIRDDRPLYVGHNNDSTSIRLPFDGTTSSRRPACAGQNK